MTTATNCVFFCFVFVITKKMCNEKIKEEGGKKRKEKEKSPGPLLGQLEHC